MPNFASLIRDVPKADIHVHFEGLVTPRLFETLKHRNKIDVPDASHVFTDDYLTLDGFINACRIVNSVIRTETDCFEIICDYLATSARAGVVHVEMAFEPEFHARRGLSYDHLIAGISRGLESGRRRFGISSCLILSLVRDLPIEIAVRNYEIMQAHPVAVDAIGLASRELNNPPSKFRDLFRRAKKDGYRLAAHAGEEGPASYVWDAICELQVDRIDHGVKGFDDPELVRFLRKSRTPIALCPISNWKTHNIVVRPSQSLQKLLRSGIVISINSDDPGILMSGIVENYEWAAKHFGLSPADIVRVAQNSISSAFMGGQRKKILLGQVENYFQQWQTTSVGRNCRSTDADTGELILDGGI